MLLSNFWEYFSALNHNFVWLVSFSDRLNFWDFGGDPDYELIRTELYKDTQVGSLVGYVTSVKIYLLVIGTNLQFTHGLIIDLDDLISQGCMLIFDVTNKSSFEKLDNWFQEFHDNGGSGAVIIVIGNKVS